MSNILDAQRTIDQLRSGTSGNRNTIDVEGTTRAIEETAAGNGERVVTPTGALASTSEEEMKTYKKQHPKKVLQVIKNLRTSFSF